MLLNDLETIFIDNQCMHLGTMNVRILRDHPEAWIPPGIAILITVLAINFIGDGLRDAFDPKSKQR